jgi:uridine phosphorylase
MEEQAPRLSFMEQHSIPLLEFDPSRDSLIEPSRVLKPVEDMPERCVLCFFQEVFEKLHKEGRLSIIKRLRSEIGTHPVYRLEMDGMALAAAHPGVGAPLAAAILDEVIALGSRKFIACGGAGVLRKEIVVGHVVIPSCAVRDEGTSYHYVPPSREVSGSPEAVAAIERALARREVPYTIGKTWTTDAIYRETPARIAARKAEGCLTVEMETAAFFAVAQFRDVTFGQMLYGGDDVSGADWDNREWHKRGSIRENLFWLAAEAALEL